MLEFSDKPYRYFPPRRIGILARLLAWLNPWVRLPLVWRVQRVEVLGRENIPPADPARRRVIYLPNHPTHADPEIFFEAARQAGVKTQFMAAYDIFLRGRLQALGMQIMGAFSIDREGSDPHGLAQAKQTILDGEYALTIFPEGNVYLQNDEVTPFLEGAALLGLKAAKEMATRDVQVQLVPVSIKATFVEDVREKVDALVERLGRMVDAEMPEGGGPLERVAAVGRAALHRNLKHRGIDRPETDDLKEMIAQAADAVLQTLEKKMDLSPRPKDSLMDRLRRARRTIHQVRIDEERIADHTAAAVWADEAMVAFRILSYPGDYVARKPTLDRYAETVEKLGEDIHRRFIPPFGRKHVTVKFGAPIDLSDHLEAFREKARRATREVTERAEAAVQRGLDEINERNPHPGGTIRVA